MSPLTASAIKKLKGRRWNTDFTSADVKTVFDESGPMDSIYYGAEFNLTWFVEQVFNNQKGKPLKLEAFQQILLGMLWYKKFPMILASRGAGKTFMLGLYALLKALLVPGSKIVIVGAGFRQAKLVFKYIEQLYNASPMIQEAVGQHERPKYGSDAATLTVGLSTIQAIPIGDGEKIRGLRATCLIADEFASIPEEIFDIVIAPFTAVHMNPAERAENKRFRDRLASIGADEKLIEAIASTQGFGNQIVISGTASYKHNHFYKRFCVYKSFIHSRGDPKLLKRALEERSLSSTGKSKDIAQEDVDRMVKTWKHYAIYQLPYTGLPSEFLDEDNIRSDHANFPTHRFAMEYMAQFPLDTDGFIKRSWIERATPRMPDEIPVIPELYGDPRETYVMGLDPARWNDNFGCVVFKLSPRGKEFVYCSAWDKTKYSESAHKIREIVKRFNIAYICMDAGGGGESVREWLCKKQDDVDDSELLWVIPDQIKKFGEAADLSAPGRKIIEMVNFTTDWISKAAHDVEACVEQCNVLFPHRADEFAIYNQYMNHFEKQNISDREMEELQADLWGLDDWDAERLSEEYGTKISQTMGAMQHIEECVNETCAIMRMVSPKGTESFELPKLAEQPEGLDMRRRDRWSALMLANYAAKVYLGSGHRPTNRTFDPRQVASPGRRSGYTGAITKRRGGTIW